MDIHAHDVSDLDALSNKGLAAYVDEASAIFRNRWKKNSFEEHLAFSIENGVIVVNIKKLLFLLPRTEEGKFDMRGFDFNYFGQLTYEDVFKQMGMSEDEVLKYYYWKTFPRKVSDAWNETKDKVFGSENFILIKIGDVENVDFSFSICARVDISGESLKNCLFKHCNFALISFNCDLLGCHFENCLFGGSDIGGTRKNETCIFANIRRIKSDILDFAWNADYENCVFRNIKFRLTRMDMLSFKNCIFDCQINGVGALMNESRYAAPLVNTRIKGWNTSFVDNTMGLFSLGRTLLRLHKIKAVSFIGCDMSKLRLKNVIIDSDVSMENCVLSKDAIAAVRPFVPFYLNHSFRWFYGIIAGLLIAVVLSALLFLR